MRSHPKAVHLHSCAYDCPDMKLFTAQLDEVVREAEERGRKEVYNGDWALARQEVQKEAHAEGFAAGIEKEAGVALNAEIDGYDEEANEPLKQMFPRMQKQIAERICALKANR